MSARLGRALLVAAVLAAWEIATGGVVPEVKLLDPLFVSRPSSIALDLAEWARTSLLSDLLVTLEEALAGLVLGIASGIALGLAFAYSRPLAYLLEPLIAALNTLPRPALAPLFVIWLGLGISSKILLSWSLVFFVVFYNTYLGARSVDPDLLDAVRSMGASDFQAFRYVILPSTLSWVFAALRISVSYALIGAVIGEFVGATSGIGYRMIIAEGLLDTDRILSALLVLGAVGSALVEIAGRIEERALKWRPSVELGRGEARYRPSAS